MPERIFKTVYTVPAVSNKGYALTMQPCQEGVLFECGKRICFDVSLTKDGKACSEEGLYAYFKWNSEKILWHSLLKLENGKAKIEFTCEWAGFGNLHLHFCKGDEEILEQIRGIAVSPERLKRSYPCPDDFDSFWEEKKKSIAVPFSAHYTEITKDSHPGLHNFSHKNLLEKDISNVTIQDVQVDCPAGTVSGILTSPKNPKPKSLPAILYLHGAGVRPCQPDTFIEQASKGYLIYNINAHGIPNDKPESWYKENQKTGRLKEYDKIGRESRETYYFLNMFLRVKRGLDFLKSLTAWDGKNLITMGGSQGAAQAFAGAYLDGAVSAFAGSIPAYGDLTGFLSGRTVEWKDWLCLKPRGRIEPKILEVAPYFDTVNFLKDYKRAACFCFGLLDQGCLPTTNYVPVSECPAQATVILQSDCYHAVSPQAEKLNWDFIAEHIKKSN